MQHAERSSLAGPHLELGFSMGTPPRGLVECACARRCRFGQAGIVCTITESGSHHPPMLPVHNHAVTTLPCSQCTTVQSPTSHAPNVQPCRHQPPMLPMHNHAVTTLQCSQCTITQSPTSHAQLPCYIHMYNHAVPNLPCYVLHPHAQSGS